MRLLVSVANAEEATAARDGGADLVDAKDPSSGALGAVSLPTLSAIRAAVAGDRPLTAALGDAGHENEIEPLAHGYAAMGCALVKVGLAGVLKAPRAARLVAAAVRGAGSGSRGRCGVVAVGYADCPTSLAPSALIDIAARAGATGVLLDTANKRGPGLGRLMDQHDLAAWVARAHDAGLLVALAGRLTFGDLTLVRDAGADVAGVRGAACEGGRTGRVVAERVRVLRSIIHRSTELSATATPARRSRSGS
jgi:uncharacterized protein (UPF0264 family)